MITLSFAGALLLLNGCGSSSSGTSTSNPVTKGTAYYVDDAVEGVTAHCGATSNVTASDGAFIYEAGGECQFKVGNILLRTQGGVSEGEIIFENDLKTARFLQTLDMDGNPQNGITIAKETATVLADRGISQVPQSDEALADVAEAMDTANIGYRGKYVTAEEAMTHMNSSYEHYFGEPLFPDAPDAPDTPNAPEVPHTPNTPATSLR